MKKLLFLFAAVIFSSTVYADVSLPKVFSDNMVIQRDVPIAIWGWAAAGENIVVSFNSQTIKSKADKNGRWKVMMRPSTHGGPFELTVTGKANSVNLKNILIGDVWLGSGQSNMEWTIKNSNDPENEIAKANYPKIRLFTVEKAMSYQPEEDLKGTWLECNPKTIGDFSAVAYFFGRKLNEELDVPIGLINSSWGGTNIQAWMSWDLMSKKEEYKNYDLITLKQSAKEMAEKQKKFDEAVKNDKGVTEKWYDPSNTTGWKKIAIPQNWEASEIGNADGYVWFKKEFEITKIPAKPVVIGLGPIDDQDETYLNGTIIGSTNSYNENRNYTVEPGVLKKGKNILVVRVYDSGGGGGIYGKANQLYYQSEDEKILLPGEWQYKASVLTTDYGITAGGPNAFPSQLFNAMIAPLIQFPVKGMIWYQGESNAWEAYNYRKLFPEMIKDWRARWNSEFTFLWVQLANFMAPATIPVNSDWAELREAQSMTLSLPKTGQAVIIDIGEENDIHPRNKQDVGYRLALAALRISYNKEIVFAGPVYKSMTSDGEKISLTFTNTGGGLMIKDKYGYVKGFAIAGEDKRFVWATAQVEGDKIVVHNPSIKNPVAVRYAWANNPDDANVYNKEGLPATPFRTDNWPGISQGPK